MKNTLTIAFVIAGLTGQSQSDFVRIYDELTDNTSNAYAITTTYDGGFVCIGNNNGEVDPDIFLVKTNGEGAAQWARQLNGAEPSLDLALDIIPTRDGGYVFCGNSARHRMISKIDAEGQDVWTSHFGNEGKDSYVSVIETQDGGFVAVGDGMVVTKLDADGNELWTRNKPTQHKSSYRSVHELPNGDLLFGGFFTAKDMGKATSVLVKSDANGKAIWAKTYGPGIINDIDTDAEGNIWAAGSVGFAVPVVQKIDAEGNAIWEGVYEEPHIGSAHSIVVKDVNEAYVFTSGGYIRINGEGRSQEHQSTMAFGFNDGLLTSNGEMVMAGFSTQNVGIYEKFAFMKLGPGGFPAPSAAK
ncbi:MAG: hypothetical protein EA392_08720 [Cryomorphaceae bacterium]|nr:MAG: hypothetical protein EA392_08720 [Cryomorphaceae bacterium]